MKKYADYSAEEKAQYKAKRDAYWTKRHEDQAEGFKRLEAELKKLKASEEVLALLKSFQTKKGERSDGYLTALFGTETPKVGQKASYLYIGVRGPNGERIKDGETMAKFITRVGDCNYKYDANSISSMCWYVKRRGYTIENDRASATVTLTGLPQ